MRDSSPRAFLVFYHPSVHAVIDLHGRMDEEEATAKASGPLSTGGETTQGTQDTHIYKSEEISDVRNGSV